jgi:hypothetical protein
MNRERMKSTSFGLPRKRKFPLTSKRQAVSAVAYSKKLARERKITPQERDIVLRKVRAKFPSISITPIRGKK